MSKHTAGPWWAEIKETLGNKDAGFLQRWSVRAGGGWIADVRDWPSQTAEANARLLAAAPDLLEAANDVLDLVEAEGRDTGLNDAFSDLRDAVAKAGGYS